VLLVDLDDNGLRAVTALPVPCFQPLQSIAGDLQSLPAQLAEAARPARPNGRCGRSPGARRRLPERSAGAHRGALRGPAGGRAAYPPRARQRPGRAVQRGPRNLDELSAEDVFAQRLDAETLEPARQSLSGLYRDVLAELREGEA
jgi:exonuclease SbcD